MTPTNEAITETEAGFGTGLRAQIERRRQVPQAELGRHDARVEASEGSVAPPPIEDAASAPLRAPAPIEAEGFDAPPEITSQGAAPESISLAAQFAAREAELEEQEVALRAREAALGDLAAELETQAHAVGTESENAFELLERERDLNERERSLATRQKDLESNAAYRSAELLAERDRLRFESDRVDAEAA